VERLIKELEEYGRKEDELRKKMKEERAEKGSEKKSWWRRILPF